MMNRLWKRIGRGLVPPALLDPYLRRFRAVRYVGDHESWAVARSRSSGYDSASILRQVTEAARAVRDGHAAFERDGKVFSEPAFVWPLLGCLTCEAVRHDGHLSVIDFGGSLGSIYFQHRKLLSRLVSTRWAVVEQEGFVRVGRHEFSTNELSFHLTLQEAAREVTPTVLLFSGVLAWLERPHELLEQAVEMGCDAIIVDRTPLIPGDRDILKIQHVPPSIYRASYPCWFLSRSRFMAHFADRYRLVAELPQADPPVEGTSFGGLYFERRDLASR